MGILSIVVTSLNFCVCGPFASFLGLGMGLAAWIEGNRDLRAMDAGEMDPTGRGLTQAGLICGIIGTVLFGIGILIAVAGILFAMILGAAVGWHH